MSRSSESVRPVGERGPQLLWEPGEQDFERAEIERFRRSLEVAGYPVGDLSALWDWSVTEIESFWASIVEWFDVRFHEQPTRVLTDRTMPGVQWFPGATVSWTEHAMRHLGEAEALVSWSETWGSSRLSGVDLRDEVARLQEFLVSRGVGLGDRVAGILPNCPEAVIALLAVSGLGAVWVACPPEFGERAVLDRLVQVSPRVLIVADAYVHRGRHHDRREMIAAVVGGLPSAADVLAVRGCGRDLDLPGGVALLRWDHDVDALHAGAVRADPVPFDHPLYILFSSGTTGAPKPIVHGHGGIVLEHLKVLGLHEGLGRDDLFCWYTTTGWMMWNYVVSALLTGATVGLFDGDPVGAGSTALWRFASEAGVTHLGASPAFFRQCIDAGRRPRVEHDLGRLRTIGSTGSSLPSTTDRWLRDQFPSVRISSISGGTDLCTAVVGGSPVLPVWSGEISGRHLGARVVAVDATGAEVVGERGEMVITEPMPSMPVGFWGDVDGSRLRSAYFDQREGVWTHGDWLTVTERGSVVISGRSDATLNRGGVRLGTAELYEVVEASGHVSDSIAVHIDDAGGGAGWIVLAVVPARSGLEGLPADLAGRVRSELSPRHVPDLIVEVPWVPRTASDKRQEVPLKRALEAALADECGDAVEPLDQLAAGLAARVRAMADART